MAFQVGKYLDLPISPEMHEENNGWWTVDTDNGSSIDEISDGGFEEGIARSIAKAANSFDLMDFTQNYFVYVGTLKSKETPSIGGDIKNEMQIQNIIKGGPDSNLVYTYSLRGRFADYSSFAQIEDGQRYLISGNHGEKLVLKKRAVGSLFSYSTFDCM